MPGMTEAHTHFPGTTSRTLDAIQRMPVEEHVVWCITVARRYLDMGWTPAWARRPPSRAWTWSRATPSATARFPGRATWRPARKSPPPAGWGIRRRRTCATPELSFGAIVNGPEEMRKMVRQFVKYGVDQLKINLSGSTSRGCPAEIDAVFRRGSGHVRVRGQALRQARGRARAILRVDQAVHTPRHRHHLPRQLHRRRGAGHARIQEGPRVRGAGPGLAGEHLRITPANGD